MADSAEKKYEEIVSRLASEFWAKNADALRKESAQIQQDLINRGLFNTTLKVSNLLDLHHRYLDRLIDFLTGSIEESYAQLRPTKCKKYLLQILDNEYGKLQCKGPSWLHQSQLSDDKMLAQFEQGVIAKRDAARNSLENKCALWEERWQQKRRGSYLKWGLKLLGAIAAILAILIPLWLAVRDEATESRSGQKTMRNSVVDPNTGKTTLNVRTRERVEQLRDFIIKEKIDPWLFVWHQSFKVTKYDGSVIEYPGLEYAEGVRRIFLAEDYIDPFVVKAMKDVLDETGQECRANGLRAEQPLKEAAALLAGMIRNVYDRLAEVDSRLRQKTGGPERVTKVDVADRITVMDEKLREHLKAALELYSDSSQ